MFWGHPFLRHAFAWHLAVVALAGLLLLVLLGLVIVWAIRRWKRIPETTSPEPLNIAKERYARGEISAAELEEIKKNLS